MTLDAIALVGASCVLHATWNLIAKRHLKDATFFWWVLAGVVALGAPPFAVVVADVTVGPMVWVCLLGGGTLIGAYFYCLGKAYAVADLTIVYPVARSAPVLVWLWGWLLLGESPTLVGTAGILAATVGVFCLPINSGKRFTTRGHLKTFGKPEMLWALATALATSGYSLIDKVGIGMTTGLDGAYVYVYIEYAVSFVVFSLLVLCGGRRRARLPRPRALLPALMVAVATLSGYFLVLVALRSSKVSYVVAFRQLSIILGAVFGFVFLRERGAWRLVGAAVISAGLVALALAK